MGGFNLIAEYFSSQKYIGTIDHSFITKYFIIHS